MDDFKDSDSILYIAHLFLMFGKCQIHTNKFDVLGSSATFSIRLDILKLSQK